MMTQLAIFNCESPSGRVYVANSKEEIENLFNKPEFYLIGFGGNENPDISYEETIKKFATVNLKDVIGKFTNFEIIETGDIGVGDLPIYKVFGKVDIFDNEGGKVFDECFKESAIHFGMRSFGKHDVVNNKFDIKKLICWDAISK